MTRGEHEILPAPGTAAAGRTARGSRPYARGDARTAAAAVLALLVALMSTTAWPTRVQAGKRDGLPNGVVAEVRIEGNVSITSEQIRAKLKSKAGSPLDARLI